jgi:hypothetical protein
MNGVKKNVSLRQFVDLASAFSAAAAERHAPRFEGALDGYEFTYG